MQHLAKAYDTAKALHEAPDIGFLKLPRGVSVGDLEHVLAIRDVGMNELAEEASRQSSAR